MGSHSTEETLGRLSIKEAGGCKLILSINNPWKVMKHGEQMIWGGSMKISTKGLFFRKSIASKESLPRHQLRKFGLAWG